MSEQAGNDAKQQLIEVFQARRAEVDRLSKALTKMGADLDPVAVLGNKVELLVTALMGEANVQNPEAMSDTRIAFEAQFLAMLIEGLTIAIEEVRQMQATASLVVPKGTVNPGAGLHLPGGGR